MRWLEIKVLFTLTRGSKNSKLGIYKNWKYELYETDPLNSDVINQQWWKEQSYFHMTMEVSSEIENLI